MFVRPAPHRTLPWPSSLPRGVCPSRGLVDDLHIVFLLLRGSHRVGRAFGHGSSRPNGDLGDIPNQLDQSMEPTSKAHKQSKYLTCLRWFSTQITRTGTAGRCSWMSGSNMTPTNQNANDARLSTYNCARRQGGCLILKIRYITIY